MKLRNTIGNSQGQVFQSWMASCLARTFLGLFRASLRGRHSMTINALRHCDREARSGKQSRIKSGTLTNKK